MAANAARPSNTRMWLLLLMKVRGRTRINASFSSALQTVSFTHDEPRSYVPNPRSRKMTTMPSGFSPALGAAAQPVSAPAASYGPEPATVAAPAAPPAKQASNDCRTPAVPEPNSRDIAVCAERPNGYRLDPD